MPARDRSSLAPLNAVHGRVFVDRNANGRYDAGEALAGAVLQIGERVRASDETGAFSFYNLWPDRYVVQLHSVPAGFEWSDVTERIVTLSDAASVTGVDFTARPIVKPIIWEGQLR